MIGHDEGLITINIAEADSPFREKTRKEMGETYRTLLGHFRHEIGHYYWDRLVAGSPLAGAVPPSLRRRRNGSSEGEPATSQSQ